MSDWKVGFVGAGVMAEVMIKGLLEQGIAASRIMASDRHEERLADLMVCHDIVVTSDNADVAATADIVVLAVKPQNLSNVLVELAGKVRSDATVVSIIAGAPLRILTAGLQHEHVVRAMPNLPCRVHRGMTVWYPTPSVDDTDRQRISEILAAMGEERQADTEAHIDMATAVNGTGPAIVAEFVKNMIEAASYIGEPRELAHDTVLATLIGTAELIQRSDVHVAQLIDEVTSPGGTTSRALQVLKQGGFGAGLTEAIDAAYQRTVELGKALDE